MTVSANINGINVCNQLLDSFALVTFLQNISNSSMSIDLLGCTDIEHKTIPAMVSYDWFEDGKKVNFPTSRFFVLARNEKTKNVAMVSVSDKLWHRSDISVIDYVYLSDDDLDFMRIAYEGE
jgi:hypothetical protein